MTHNGSRRRWFIDETFRFWYQFDTKDMAIKTVQKAHP